MDLSFVKKEEYNEDDCTHKILKKEEYIPTKREEPHGFNQQFTSSTHVSMTLDWKNHYQQFPFLFSNEDQRLPPTSTYFSALATNKPFIIIKDGPANKLLSSQSINLKIEQSTEETPTLVPEKKKVVKNYVGLLCAGFARSILKADEESEILIYMHTLINKHKQKYLSLCHKADKELFDSMMTHIYKSICGKRVRKSNTERDFKIRNVKDILKIVRHTVRDTEMTRLNKDTLKEMFEYFFTSDYYQQWLSKGMITEPNRLFFLRNKEEIHKKFQNPGGYKPRFSQSLNEELIKNSKLHVVH